LEISCRIRRFGRSEEMKKWISSKASTKAEYMMEDNGSFDPNEIRYYKADEVDAERAKDKEEIARLRKTIEDAYKCCNDKRVIKMLREALEGE
jgi:hypothetical protein